MSSPTATVAGSHSRRLSASPALRALTGVAAALVALSTLTGCATHPSTLGGDPATAPDTSTSSDHPASDGDAAPADPTGDKTPGYGNGPACVRVAQILQDAQNTWAATQHRPNAAEKAIDQLSSDLANVSLDNEIAGEGSDAQRTQRLAMRLATSLQGAAVAIHEFNAHEVTRGHVTREFAVAAAAFGDLRSDCTHRGGDLPADSATTADTPAWPGTPLSVRLQHDARNDVLQVQSRLNDLGYAQLDLDGHFGAQTQAAVIRFQSDHGLNADGVVGPATWTALFAPEAPGDDGDIGTTMPTDPAPPTPPSWEPEPYPVPAGNVHATCADGTTSYSANDQGTCSHHGGVSSWLH